MKPVDLFRQWLLDADIKFSETADADGTYFCVEPYIGSECVISFDEHGNLMYVGVELY